MKDESIWLAPSSGQYLEWNKDVSTAVSDFKATLPRLQTQNEMMWSNTECNKEGNREAAAVRCMDQPLTKQLEAPEWANCYWLQIMNELAVSQRLDQLTLLSLRIQQILQTFQQ